MPFYALRIVCQNCGGLSVLGGSTKHDLTRWRALTVECGRCGAETSSSDAQAVNLNTLASPEYSGENVVQGS